MIDPPFHNATLFDCPATYRITVQGKICPSSVDLMGGMSVKHTALETGHTLTTLEGELRDQAALAGVLNTLYELHLPVLMVMHLTFEQLGTQKNDYILFVV